MVVMIAIVVMIVITVYAGIDVLRQTSKIKDDESS